MAGPQTDVVTSIELNGVDFRDYGGEITSVEGRGLSGNIVERVFEFADEPPRQFGDRPGVPTHNLSGYIYGSNETDCRKKYAEFLYQAGFIVDVEQQLNIRSVKNQMHTLRYFDEPHKTYRVLYAGGHTRRALKTEQWRIGKYLYFDISFKIPDIWAYGEEINRSLNLSSSNHFLHLLTGNAPSRPRVIFKNNTSDDIERLDIIAGPFALNSNFNEIDTGGYPKARGIKNDQDFTGDIAGENVGDWEESAQATAERDTTTVNKGIASIKVTNDVANNEYIQQEIDNVSDFGVQWDQYSDRWKRDNGVQGVLTAYFQAPATTTLDNSYLLVSIEEADGQGIQWNQGEDVGADSWSRTGINMTVLQAGVAADDTWYTIKITFDSEQYNYIRLYTGSITQDDYVYWDI